MISKEQNKWYPVYTNPRAEKKAYEALVKKGIAAYLPLHKQLKQWSDRKKWVDEPLIKSYLFVNISIKQMGDVLTTPGICRFIYFSGKVAAMPEKQIVDLQLLLANETDLELTDHRFAKGERVAVKAGPLKGFSGELVELRSQKKFILRIDHIGQTLIVQMPQAFLEPIGFAEAVQ
jgi:transcription antitermination factor NusG